MAKTSCKKGQYYCNTDKKCKPIPDGYKVREDGFLISEGSNPRIARKKGNLPNLKNTLIYILMKILKELFMDWVSRTLLLLKQAWRKLGNLVDHMLIKFKQQLLWSKEQE